MSNAVYPYYHADTTAGAPAVGYKLYTYESGTVTAKATYTTSALTVANANPVVLDARGNATIFLGAGNYKFVLKTAADVDVETFDPVAGTGGSDSSAVSTVATIAALKALSYSGTTILGASFVNVQGYYAAADGGGGLFYWSSSSSATDNGGTVIRPTGSSTNGRWLRIVDGSEMNVRWFGAKGDAATDDYAEIIAAKDAIVAIGGGTLLFPYGTYLHTQAMTIPVTVATKMEPFAKFTAGSALAITFEGQFAAGLHEVFDDSTTAVFSRYGQEVLPEWWSSANSDQDLTEDWLAAINEAIASLTYGSVYLIGVPKRIGTPYTLTTKAGVILRGPGMSLLKRLDTNAQLYLDDQTINGSLSLGMSTSGGGGTLTVGGYTTLGSECVPLKGKYFSGNLNSGEGTTITHGLTYSTIIGFDMLVDNSGILYPPNGDPTLGYAVNFTSTDITVGAQAAFYSDPYKIIVWYTT
ncbi:hypothetical protein KJ865_13005 [Myxococcota bacterium]|nr:hypothetical protein [Myxococcota bacterium]